MCPGTFNQLFWYSLAAHCWYSDARHLTQAMIYALKQGLVAVDDLDYGDAPAKPPHA